MPFEPYISFRKVSANSLDLIDPPVQQPSNALTRGTNLLLLIHGYNSSVAGASESYTGWQSLQNELGGIANANVVGVYWPGSNWESVLVYLQAIGKAEQTAQRLARALHAAAAGFGVLRLSILTHSLGARVTLNLVERLQKDANPRIQLERFVVMAAAFPTRFLSPGRPIRQSLDQARTPFLNLYSEADAVLHYAFPLAESIHGSGFFPTALGRTKWTGGSAITAPQLTQQENTGSGHTTYWYGETGAARASALRAGRLARGYLGLGAVARETPTRDTPTR
ncbi:MAG TPA: alpha/beta hydrolase [Thermoanaerobaculia bacterium]|nr:alpha/beta hydrolase [Thermoanaerobaculia bacterium]